MLLLHPGAAGSEGLAFVTPDVWVAAGEGERLALTAGTARLAGADPADRGFPTGVSRVVIFVGVHGCLQVL